jgi:hypothetical protein
MDNIYNIELNDLIMSLFFVRKKNTYSNILLVSPKIVDLWSGFNWVLSFLTENPCS